jgi:hypothetical protein
MAASEIDCVLLGGRRRRRRRHSFNVDGIAAKTFNIYQRKQIILPKADAPAIKEATIIVLMVIG